MRTAAAVAAAATEGVLGALLLLHILVRRCAARGEHQPSTG